MGDIYVKQFNELKSQSPVTARFIFEILAKEVGIDVNQQQELALNASLVANRLGLSFNKSLKAFDSIQDKTSPEAFDKLKLMYQKLLSEHQQLLEVKTPTPTVEYVEKVVVEYVEKVVTVQSQDNTRIEFLENKVKQLEGELRDSLNENCEIKIELNFANNEIRDLKDWIKDLKLEQSRVKPQTDNRFLLPGN